MSGVVSIIIPTYNREKFLPYALESIKNQTYKNWELIIVDDGSTDNTREICQSFAKSVENSVRYIYQDNQGVAGARNTGLKAAQGDFIAFLDSDDRWCAWHLKKSIKAFQLEPTLDFVFAAGRKIHFYTGKVLIKHNFFKKGNSHPVLSPKVARKKDKLYILKNNHYCKKVIIEHGLPSGLQCMVFKRQTIAGEYFNPELKIAEDRYFIYKLILKNKKCAFWLSINTLRFVHDTHVSGEVINSPVKLEFIARNLIKAYKLLLPYASSFQEKRVINQKIAEYYLYYLMPSLSEQGRKKEAFVAVLRALIYNPIKINSYKSLLSVILK